MGTLWMFDPGSREVIPLWPRRSPVVDSVSALLNISGGWTMIALYGEMDLQATYLLREVPQSECEGLIFDLHGVTFMDAAGLGALIACHKRMQARGEPRLVAPSTAARRILHLTGTTHAFTTFRTLDAALAAPRARESVQVT
jgi:anti-anti-sigma factor